MVIRLTRLFLCLGALSFLGACGTTSTALRLKVRDEFANGKYREAEKDLLDPKNLQNERNSLLTLLDLGLVAHYDGDFEKSNFFLFKAKKLARELYTKSISEGAASLLWNDNAKTYPGMEYELSLVHYYATLNFLFLSQLEAVPPWEIKEAIHDETVLLAHESHRARVLSNRDRGKFRGQARSELLAWNAFLDQVRARNRGEPYYKDDLLNKTFASYVHEGMGTARDRNIAEILLKDADRMLIRAYSAYPSFNRKWQEYVDNYSKFEALGEAAVERRFIEPTPNFLLTKDEIIADQKKGNVYYLVEGQEVPEKREKTYVVGLSTVMDNIKDPALRRSVEEIGARVFLEMAPKFGLAFFAAAVVGGATGDDPRYLSDAVDSAVGFAFKLPVIDDSVVEHEKFLVFTDESGREKKLPLALLCPVADIAKLNVNRRAQSLAIKTGLRVGAKYLAALVPAILAYKRMERSPEFLRMAAATAIWIAGKKAVDASEGADLRSWLLLPRWIGGVEISLGRGLHQVRLEEPSGGRSTALGSIVVGDGRSVHRARIFSSGLIKAD